MRATEHRDLGQLHGWIDASDALNLRIDDLSLEVRTGRAGQEPHRAVAFTREGCGSHFDPEIVQAVDDTLDQFVRIAATWSDE